MNEKEQKLADKFLDAAFTTEDISLQSNYIMLYGNLVSAIEIRTRKPSP